MIRNNSVGLRIRLFAAIVLLGTGAFGRVHAVTIGIDLGPARNIYKQGPPPSGEAINASAFETALAGTTLHGQSLSLDLSFLNGEFVRLFTLTDASFISLLTLQIHGSGSVGFPEGSAYLVDQQGHPLQMPEQLGIGVASDHSAIYFGLLPLLSGELQRPMDFYGIHFDLILPSSPSITITGGDFQLQSPRGVFGIGPGLQTDIVPDVSNTLCLLGIGLFGLTALRHVRGLLIR